MKKALVFVLVLGFLGTMAFAQSSGLTWSGYADYGALLSSSTVGTTTTSSLLSYGTDSWTNGRVQLDGMYTGKNFGWDLMLRYQGPYSNSGGSAPIGGAFVQRAYGWVDLANGMVKVQAGQLGDYTWSTGQYSSFGNFDGVTGVQVQIIPTKGVNLGAFVPTYSSGTNTATLSNALNATSIGGSYTSDMLYAAAGYTISSNDLWFGLNYTGMKDLSAYIETNSTVGAATGNNFYADEYVAYNLGQATVGTYADQYYDSTVGFQFHFSPQVSYTMNNVVLGARGDLAIAGSDMGYGAGVYAKLNVAKGAWIQAGGAFDSGTVAPTSSTQSVYDPVYFGGPFATTTTSTTLLRAFVDVGTSF